MSRATASLILTVLLSSCSSVAQPGTVGSSLPTLASTTSIPTTTYPTLAAERVTLDAHATDLPVFVDGSVWVGVRHGRAGEVVRVDPTAGSVVDRISIEDRSDDVDVSVDGRSLFVESGRAVMRSSHLWAVDPRSNALVPITTTKDGVWPSPSIAGDSIWVSTVDHSCCARMDVVRLDRETHRRLDRYVLDDLSAPPQLVSAEGSLFVLGNRYRDHRPPILRTIDPATGELSVVSTIPYDFVNDLRYEYGTIWMLAEREHRWYVVGLDPATGDPTVEIAVEAQSYGFGDGVIWVLGRARTGWGLQAFDLETGETRGGPFGPTMRQGAMLVTEGAAWIVNQHTGSLVRVDLPQIPAG